MEKLPFGTVLEIVRFIGSPEDSFVIPCVCKAWVNVLDAKDGELWMWMAAEFNVVMHSPRQSRSLRSTSNYKSVFRKASIRGSDAIREKHEMLLLQARSYFSEANRDCPKRLNSLILSVFPKTTNFDVNLTSSVVEANTLASMCSRGANRPKCLKLLLETYKGDVDIGDMGGFNPLILSAYHGNLSCAMYCVKRGANLFAMGRERSGIYLIAEHWASIRGHWDVFEYLRSTRLKLQKKMYLSTQKKTTTLSRKSRPLKRIAPENTVLRTDVIPSCTVYVPDTYCVCSRGYIGSMVECDGPNCPIGWFHYTCVGLVEDLPDDAQWLCSSCIGACISDSSNDLSVPIFEDGFSTPSSRSSSSSDSALTPPLRYSSDALVAATQTSASSSASSLRSAFDDEMMTAQDMPYASLCASSSSPNHGSSSTPQPIEYVHDTYCVCSRGHIGSMVKCDGPNCLVGWFHYTCVGLVEDLPDDAQWLCPSCEAGSVEGGEGGVGGLQGEFPEPKPSYYSSFLNNHLPNLNINSAVLVEKAQSDGRAKVQRKDGEADRVRKYNKKVKIEAVKDIEILVDHGGVGSVEHIDTDFPPPL